MQWITARCLTSRALYIAFRGTYDLGDVAISTGFAPGFEAQHCVGVHSGIASVLTDPHNNVIEQIDSKLKELCARTVPIVLCGHSLGGGYAQVAACHLVHMGWKVAAVRTFGSLHPLAPFPGSSRVSCFRKLFPSLIMSRCDVKCKWTLDKLIPVMQHYVHAWDPIPRVLVCRKWREKVLPNFKLKVLGVHIELVPAGKLIEDASKSVLKQLEKYDVFGEVVMVSAGSPTAFVRASKGTSLKELLGEAPPQSITHEELFSYHRMADYLSILERVGESRMAKASSRAGAWSWLQCMPCASL